MKKISAFLIALFILSNNIIIAQTGFNLNVQSVVDSVNADSMWAKLGILQTKERYTKNSNTQNSANYLKNYMLTMGFDTVYFQNYSIYGSSYVSPNIIGVKYGKIKPDSIFIVCAHWDSYRQSAPASDDNGSGTVAAIEAARVLLKQDYEKTIKVCLFSGEELGLLGSEAYVNSIGSSNKIGAVINLDMVAFQQQGMAMGIGIFSKPGTAILYNKARRIQQLYVPGISIGQVSGCNYSCTDIYSFWDAGYDGLYFEESSTVFSYESPYIHTMNDLINTSSNSKEKLKLTTKLVAASIATWAKPYSIPNFVNDNNANSINIFYNYPNPFNLYTKIYFKLTENENVTLKVVNNLGKEVALLIDNEYKEKGDYAIDFNAEFLNDGVYYYQIITGKNTKTQKMMLIK